MRKCKASCYVSVTAVDKWGGPHRKSVLHLQHDLSKAERLSLIEVSMAWHGAKWSNMGDMVKKDLEDQMVSPLENECTRNMGEFVEVSLNERVKFNDIGLSMVLQNGLENLRLENSLTDVTLRVGSMHFSCHRVVLAAASNYFR